MQAHQPKYTYSAAGYANKNHNQEQARLVSKIIGKQTGGGAGVIFLTNRDNQWCVVAVKERCGKYVGMFNFPCGKHETPNGQPIVSMKDESHQEFTYHAGFEAVSCRHVLGKTALIQIGRGRGTFVACVVLNTAFSRATVNSRIAQNNKDASLPDCYKEVSAVELIPVANLLACKRDDKHYIVQNMPDAKKNVKQLTVTSFLIAAVHDFHKIGVF